MSQSQTQFGNSRDSAYQARTNCPRISIAGSMPPKVSVIGQPGQLKYIVTVDSHCRVGITEEFRLKSFYQVLLRNVPCVQCSPVVTQDCSSLLLTTLSHIIICYLLLVSPLLPNKSRLLVTRPLSRWPLSRSRPVNVTQGYAVLLYYALLDATDQDESVKTARLSVELILS